MCTTSTDHYLNLLWILVMMVLCGDVISATMILLWGNESIISQQVFPVRVCQSYFRGGLFASAHFLNCERENSPGGSFCRVLFIMCPIVFPFVVYWLICLIY